jgi:hypothetical protein
MMSQRFFFLLLVAGLVRSWGQPIQPLSPNAANPSWLKVYVGPDSNVCGITTPTQKSKRPLPIVLWLHGGMRSRNPEKGYTAHRAALELLSQDSAYFISPSAYAGADWLSGAGIRHIDGCLDYVMAHYPVKASPIWGMGVSDGTLGLIRYTLQGKHSLARRVLVSTYPDLALPAHEVAGQVALTRGTWDIFIGGEDRLFPAQPVLQACQIWSRQLKNFHVHFEPQGEHDFSWWLAHQKVPIQAALTGQEKVSH